MSIKPEIPPATRRGSAARSAVYTPEVLETLRESPGVSFRISDGHESRPSTWAPRQKAGNEDLRLKTVQDEDGTYVLYGMSVQGLDTVGQDRFDDYLEAEAE